MDTQKLQQLTDTIESKVLQVAGNIAMDRAMKGITKPTHDDDLLGEAIEALLEVKRELGLSSALSIVKSEGANE
jgi:hypothetical protein